MLLLLFFEPATEPATRMVLKALTQAELAILAAGPPAHRLHDERGWKAERNRYDRLVKR